ncbi:hypothetical protein [Vibrio coralliilyticus]|uniref:hypothetical protein n=1 Tax=Vibrio coralliilyticus TaxID=190893 RepID=UPI00148DB64D|nr:hypothetical protein [Vibrio coralliilyticus]NOI30193.1 hypothetical protein [Vibrio coralliilyticus]NOI46833.1 hypothetical protein [Vibrio coralliilyticus]
MALSAIFLSFSALAKVAEFTADERDIGLYTYMKHTSQVLCKEYSTPTLNEFVFNMKPRIPAKMKSALAQVALEDAQVFAENRFFASKAYGLSEKEACSLAESNQDLGEVVSYFGRLFRPNIIID